MEAGGGIRDVGNPNPLVGERRLVAHLPTVVQALPEDALGPVPPSPLPSDDLSLGPEGSRDPDTFANDFTTVLRTHR